MPAATISALKNGGVIAYPTEAVWGLGCDPFDEAAVSRLLAIKNRPADKGLILVAGRVAQLDDLLDWKALPADRRDAVLASWPGPNTWIVPATARVPRWITGEHRGVAVRVSAHPVVVALCDAFGGPLVSTSANLSGQPPAFNRDALDPALLARLDAITDGETGGLAAPTAIRDARSGAPCVFEIPLRVTPNERRARATVDPAHAPCARWHESRCGIRPARRAAEPGESRPGRRFPHPRGARKMRACPAPTPAACSPPPCSRRPCWRRSRARTRRR